jgi:hypothetical protein
MNKLIAAADRYSSCCLDDNVESMSKLKGLLVQSLQDGYVPGYAGAISTSVQQIAIPTSVGD